MTETLPARISRTLGLKGGDVFRDLQHEMDSLLGRFSRSWDGGEVFAGFNPALDLSEADDALTARMDIPGMKAEDIDIQVSGDVLRISGERKEEKEEKGRTFHWTERRTGSFLRSVTLPCPVISDKVSAEYKDGVLTITLPKSAEAKTQRIPVKPR